MMLKMTNLIVHLIMILINLLEKFRVNLKKLVYEAQIFNL